MEQSESGLTNGYVVLTFESVDEIQWCHYSIDTSLTVLSHGTIYLVHNLTNGYVVLTFESVDEILWCDHSNETSSAVLPHNTLYFIVNVIIQNESLTLTTRKVNLCTCRCGLRGGRLSFFASCSSSRYSCIP